MIEKEEAMKRLEILIDDKSQMSPINKFIDTLGWKDYDKWDVRQFLNKLEEEDYSKNYRRFCFYSIKLLFEAMDKEWDLNPRKDLPKKPTKGESRTPVMTKDQVKAMIEYTILKGEPYEEFYICCATTYGLRRGEIQAIKPRDLKFEETRDDGLEEDTIYIRTKKGGEKKEQWIPPEIKPILKDYDFDRKVWEFDISIMNDIFDDILQNVGIEKERGMGFHSIRRALRTEMGRALRDAREKGGTGLVESDIYQFLRWRTSDKEKKLLSIYDKSDTIEGDKEIFKIHPFLEYWT